MYICMCMCMYMCMTITLTPKYPKPAHHRVCIKIYICVHISVYVYMCIMKNTEPQRPQTSSSSRPSSTAPPKSSPRRKWTAQKLTAPRKWTALWERWVQGSINKWMINFWKDNPNVDDVGPDGNSFHFLFFFTLKPRVEWHKCLRAFNMSPPRNRCTFL